MALRMHYQRHAANQHFITEILSGLLREIKQNKQKQKQKQKNSRRLKCSKLPADSLSQQLKLATVKAKMMMKSWITELSEPITLHKIPITLPSRWGVSQTHKWTTHTHTQKCVHHYVGLWLN